MITKKVIDELYNKYRKRPASVDCLDIGILFDEVSDNHDINLTPDGKIVIEDMDPNSPFRSIPLNHVHAIVRFEKKIAIVLHSSILFLNIEDSGTHVHLKIDPPSFWEKLRWKFSRK